MNHLSAVWSKAATVNFFAAAEAMGDASLHMQCGADGILHLKASSEDFALRTSVQTSSFSQGHVSTEISSAHCKAIKSLRCKNLEAVVTDRCIQFFAAGTDQGFEMDIAQKPKNTFQVSELPPVPCVDTQGLADALKAAQSLVRSTNAVPIQRCGLLKTGRSAELYGSCLNSVVKISLTAPSQGAFEDKSYTFSGRLFSLLVKWLSGVKSPLSLAVQTHDTPRAVFSTPSDMLALECRETEIPDFDSILQHPKCAAVSLSRKSLESLIAAGKADSIWTLHKTDDGHVSAETDGAAGSITEEASIRSFREWDSYSFSRADLKKALKVLPDERLNLVVLADSAAVICGASMNRYMISGLYSNPNDA